MTNPNDRTPNNRNTGNGNPRKQAVRHGGNVTSMIIVVVGVLAILLIVWFLANTIIDMTGKRTTSVGVNTGAQQTQQSSGEALPGTSESAEAPGVASEEPADSTETSETPAEPEQPAITVVPGDGDLKKPETWPGKTFSYRVRVNARSGPSTSAGVLGGISVGQTMQVTDTRMVGDTLWVYGTVKLDNGSTVEAWTIASGLNKTPK